MSNCKVNTRPTGMKPEECFELSLKTGIFLKNIEEFTIDNLNNKEFMQLQVDKGNVVVVTELHNAEDTSTERTLYESGDLSVYTSLGNKKLKAELHTTTCGHRALLSYADAGFEWFIPITEDGKAGIIYDGNEDGFIKGQSIGKILVSMRKMASKDKAPVSEVIISFKDYMEFDKHGLYVDLDYNVMLDLNIVTVLSGSYNSPISIDGSVISVSINIDNSCLSLTLDEAIEYIRDAEYVFKDKNGNSAVTSSSRVSVSVTNGGLVILLSISSDETPQEMDLPSTYVRINEPDSLRRGFYLNTKNWEQK